MTGRRAITEDHRRLGVALRSARRAARVTTRGIPGYSSGHISSVENGFVAPSEDLIEAYVSMFGNATTLRALFGQMRRAGESTRQRQRRRLRSAEQASADPPQDMSEVSEQGDVTRHYVTEAHEAHALFGPTGALVELRSRVSIRARTPGTRLYYAGSFYEAEKRPGVLTAEPVAGMSLVEQREGSTGALKSFFSLARPLSPDDPDPYDLAYVTRVETTRRALPQLAYYAPVGTVRMGLRATFDPAARPEQLWRFAAPNFANLDHRPEDEMRPDADLSYADDFEALVPGWCYGFSWRWSDDEPS